MTTINSMSLFDSGFGHRVHRYNAQHHISPHATNLRVPEIDVKVNELGVLLDEVLDAVLIQVVMRLLLKVQAASKGTPVIYILIHICISLMTLLFTLLCRNSQPSEVCVGRGKSALFNDASRAY